MNRIDHSHNPVCNALDTPERAEASKLVGLIVIVFGGLSLLFGANCYKARGILRGTHVQYTPRNVYGPLVREKCGDELSEGNRFDLKVLIVFLGALSVASALAAIGLPILIYNKL